MRKALIVPVLEPFFSPLPPEAREPVAELVEVLEGIGRFEVTCIEGRREHRLEFLEPRIKAWIAALGQDDLGFLYFGGHGMDADGDALLACRDATADGSEGWLRVSELLAGFKAGRLLIVLDTCHAGAAIDAIQKTSLPQADQRCWEILAACPAHDEALALGPLTPTLIDELHGDIRTPRFITGAVQQRVPDAPTSGSWLDQFSVPLNPGSHYVALAAHRRSVQRSASIRLAPWDNERILADHDEIRRLVVPLDMRPALRGGDERDHVRGPQADGRWSIADLLSFDSSHVPWVTGRWLVVGGPGAGKSTMLRRAALQLASDPAPDPRWVPIWAPLTRMAALGCPTDLATIAGSPRSSAMLADAVERGRAVFLCDSLDEVPQAHRQAVISWLHELPGVVIVASRPHGLSLEAPFVRMDVQPLGPELQEALLSARLRDAPSGRAERAHRFLREHRRALGELAGNPFYLALLALVFKGEATPEAVPARMYIQVVELLLEGRHRSDPNAADLPPAVRNPPLTLQALARIALRMTEAAQDEDDADAVALGDSLDDPEFAQILACVRRITGAAQDEVDADVVALGDLLCWLDDDPACAQKPPLKLVEDIARCAGFLVADPDRPRTYRFVHRAFREVLCAQALVDQFDGDARALAASVATLTSEKHLALWANPWALAAGLTANADPLLQRLLDANQALAVAALHNAYAVSRETFVAFLSRPLPHGTGDLEKRRSVYLAVATKSPDVATALMLVGDLVGRRLAPEERWFLDELCDAVRKRWFSAEVEASRRSIYADLPAARSDLIPWSELIPAGRFWQGSPDGAGHYDEQPRREVTLTRSYCLSATSVTNRQWRVFDPEHEPRRWRGVRKKKLADHPVVDVTWYAAQAFCHWLSLSWGRDVRLPTEAEWERACRGPNGEDEANRDRWWFGDDEALLSKHAWYRDNSRNRTHTVGTTPGGPGPWGLHDMHGNVWEWCSDWWDTPIFSRAEGVGENIDPEGPFGGSWRVIRGGACLYPEDACRSAFRYLRHPASRNQQQGNQGFRVLLPTVPGT